MASSVTQDAWNRHARRYFTLQNRVSIFAVLLGVPTRSLVQPGGSPSHAQPLKIFLNCYCACLQRAVCIPIRSAAMSPLVAIDQPLVHRGTCALALRVDDLPPLAELRIGLVKFTWTLPSHRSETTASHVHTNFGPRRPAKPARRHLRGAASVDADDASKDHAAPPRPAQHASLRLRMHLTEYVEPSSAAPASLSPNASTTNAAWLQAAACHTLMNTSAASAIAATTWLASSGGFCDGRRGPHFVAGTSA